MTNVTHSRLVRMSIKKVDGPQDHHRFIDEAGDMTFHSGKRGRKTSSIGMDGVSRCFMIVFSQVGVSCFVTNFFRFSA